MTPKQDIPEGKKRRSRQQDESQVIAVQCPPALQEAVIRRAAAEGVSVAELLRRIVEEAVEQADDGPKKQRSRVWRARPRT